MHAVHHGHYGVAKLLAQYGANVNLRAKNGSSAFDIANLIGINYMYQKPRQNIFSHTPSWSNRRLINFIIML